MALLGLGKSQYVTIVKLSLRACYLHVTQSMLNAKPKGCFYRAKYKSHVKAHLASTHDIGVTWHECPVDGCSYRAKRKEYVKTHLASTHDMGLTWHERPMEGCSYRAKEKGSVTRHLASTHYMAVT